MVSNGSEEPGTPLIGLSTYVERAHYGVWSEDAALLPHSYVQAVNRSGGIAVLLPPSSVPSAPAQALEVVDGLVLTGGPDVDPELYGANAHEQTDLPRAERDAWEVALCRAALEREIPLLAICRGLQILNVAAGGTLHQHLPDVLGHESHRTAPGRMSPNHVNLAPGSAVAGILGTKTIGLCHHHQGIDRLGDRLVSVGFAEDGTVEAVERPGSALAVGVQWHPEDNPEDDRLFAALVSSASEHRRRSRGGTTGGGPDPSATSGAGRVNAQVRQQ